MAVELEKYQELLRNKLGEYFGDKIVAITITPQHELVVEVDRSAIVAVCERLKSDPDFDFKFLSYMTAVDYSALGRTPRYDCVYELLCISKPRRIRVKAAVPEDDPAIDTVCGVWEGANWMEREAFDMFGIIFRNHPDLRRILMPDDWEGHPLRKDFPLGGVKSFYFKRATDPRAGEPKNLVPRVREQFSDI